MVHYLYIEIDTLLIKPLKLIHCLYIDKKTLRAFVHRQQEITRILLNNTDDDPFYNRQAKYGINTEFKSLTYTQKNEIFQY